MRYAIVSDLHANLPAWKAVQLDFAALGAERVICLGDTIGYGPQPAEVLEAVHASVHHFVLGNHEAAVCGKMDEELFSDRARAALRWTRERLGAAARRVFEGWPLTLKGPGFRCAHGDFGAPALFHYVIEPEDAAPSWRATEEALLFVGHSHSPGIYLLGASGTPRRVEPRDFAIEPGKRYLVNVGAVGQPRDGDPRASYCIFDGERRAVHWRRVPYDLDAYRDALRRAGLPENLDPVLRHDPRRGTPPLRPQLGFRPPTDAARGARGVVEVADIADLRRRARAWRALALGLGLLVGAAAAGFGYWAWKRRAEGPDRLDGRPAGPVFAALEENLAALPPGPWPPGAAPAGWAIERGNRRRQSFALSRGTEGETVLRLRSETAAEGLFARGPMIRVEPGQRYTVEALFRKAGDWAGNVGLAVALTRTTPDGGTETQAHFVDKAPNLPRRDGWRAARETFVVPAGGRAIELRLGGRFRGEVEIAQVTLARRN